MKKRELSTQEILRLSESIQLALLAGIASSRHWERGDLTFQGGTCLRLVYGSPRFSEDLDFVTASGTGLQRVARNAAAVARVRLGIADDWVWQIKGRDDNLEEGAEERNPRSFMLTVQSPEWHRAIKVKLEFWVAREEAVKQYPAAAQMTRPQPKLAEAMSAQSQVLIDAATLEAIVADKIYAIAGRDYLKARDWFDLWWLSQTYPQATEAQMAQWMREQVPVREALYPNGLRATELREQLRGRVAEVRDDEARVAKDIARWLALDPLLAKRADFIVTEAANLVAAIAEGLVLQPTPPRPPTKKRRTPAQV